MVEKCLKHQNPKAWMLKVRWTTRAVQAKEVREQKERKVAYQNQAKVPVVWPLRHQVNSQITPKRAYMGSFYLHITFKNIVKKIWQF